MDIMARGSRIFSRFSTKKPKWHGHNKRIALATLKCRSTNRLKVLLSRFWVYNTRWPFSSSCWNLFVSYFLSSAPFSSWFQTEKFLLQTSFHNSIAISDRDPSPLYGRKPMRHEEELCSFHPGIWEAKTHWPSFPIGTKKRFPREERKKGGKKI